MYINELGNLSQYTPSKHIETTTSIEFSFNISLAELNESMTAKIAERLNEKGCILADITAVCFFATPDFDNKSMRFEVSVYYPENGDNWGGCVNIPVKLTDEEFKQFKQICLVPLIASIIQV